MTGDPLSRKRNAIFRQVDGDRTRAALQDAALEEFAARGFSGARVRDIAQRAGVSKDLIAYHFGGKAGLYLAVEQAWLRREDSFADASLPPDELLARYLHDALADPRPSSQPTSTPPSCAWSCSRSWRYRWSSPTTRASSSAPSPAIPSSRHDTPAASGV
jgi:AcrR family transcriptional regulator